MLAKPNRMLSAGAAALALCLAAGPLAAAPAAAPPSWEVPVAVKKLANGLTVVVSEDHSSPVFGISVVYGVGFRLEPRGRTGFAHLFEHMMFQGTPVAPKGVFDRVIEGGGGLNNGSTRLDYTNYIATAPVSALEPILWLEADRMRTLDFSPANLKNQQEVVKEEVRVNVQNRPYGAFYWIDLAGLAFDRWENAHDGYGSFADLDAATLEDVEAFHRTYYAPNNAVLALAGDLDPARVFELAEKYFAALPAQPPPPRPELVEPRNPEERTLVQSDAFAAVPGLAIGWKTPDPGSPDYVPLAVLAEVLLGGEASRLYQRLVKGDELALELAGGVNWPLGTYLTNGGTTLLVVLAIYKPSTDAASFVAKVQEEIARVARDGVAQEDLRRAKSKMLADLYGQLEVAIDRADLVGIRQLLTGDAASINRVPAAVEAVSSADLRRVAATWLTAEGRSWIDRRPVEAASDAPAPGSGD
jgi:predicted Zn-dependent peptidase